ncbi:hypothetical protein BDZ91DRAFT_793632 [Kalaharituber pfeilii]|nr:hypothetical protein BDZ91DRAFT_793632 [Kalaharituber pfeilii]
MPSLALSDSTLPSMYSSFERTAREGEQFHRRHPSITAENMSTASPISPTTMYGPFPPKYQPPPQPSNSNPYTTPPESRKNSKNPEDEKRQLPSLHEALHEAGLAPSSTSILHPHQSGTSSYSSHSSLPPVHTSGPLPSVQHPPHTPSHTGSFSQPPPPPPPPLHPPPEQRYDYHESRNGYCQNHPTPVHPNTEPYPQRQASYPHPPSTQYPPPRPHASSHNSFPGPPPPPGYQFSHGSTSSQSAPPASTNQPLYPQNNMPPPYGPPYHHESNGAHPPAYSQGSSPTSKVLGKRTSTGYGGAIEQALHVSSMRLDLEKSRTRSLSIYNLVQRLYDQNGSSYQNHGLDVVLAEFQKAVRDAEELKEGLESCRRLLADMCKEQEQQSALEKGRPHMQDYEVEEHGYQEDSRNAGMQQPELKKIRRGRAAPPGRCHSCHRAETPEWRRGPDGARTLCNACGLHYAKLTRKMSKSTLAANAITRKSPNAALQ